MPLLVFEFLGTTELLVIAVVALIIFGPRKLPEIGRTLGRSLAEFKRASEDFKRTWEYEVEMERTDRDARVGEVVAVAPAALAEGDSPGVAAAGTDGVEAQPAAEEQTIARGSTDGEVPAQAVEDTAGADDSAAGGKKDWL